jgi:hypothetical protein
LTIVTHPHLHRLLLRRTAVCQPASFTVCINQAVHLRFGCCASLPAHAPETLERFLRIVNTRNASLQRDAVIECSRGQWARANTRSRKHSCIASYKPFAPESKRFPELNAGVGLNRCVRDTPKHHTDKVQSVAWNPAETVRPPSGQRACVCDPAS